MALKPEPTTNPIADFFESIPAEFWRFLFFSGLLVLGWFFARQIMFLTIAAYVLMRIAWIFWVHYVQQDFKAGIEWIVLEIIPPREVLRNPKAMELFLTNALYHWSGKGGLEAYWQGAVWFWHSLELVSIDGKVHFYIRVPSRLKGLVETQMYAQYPQAQIKEVEDYTLAVDEITENGKWKFWGCEFKLEKPQSYPIKTYVDYGLDKDPKEEYKIDPISPIIELFAALKKGEQMWIQFVVRPAKQEDKIAGAHREYSDKSWTEEAEEELNKVLKRYAAPDVTDAPRPPGFASADLLVKGIQAKVAKIGFDTGIRVCYVAKKEAWSMDSRRNIRLIFRQYANPSMNSLVRHNATQADAFATNLLSSFFLLSDATVTRLCNRMLNQYRDRSFFHGSFREELFHHLPWPISPIIFPRYFLSTTFVLNVEELATLWHFPGQIVKLPTLERMESKEAAPPTNLPM